MKLDFDQNDSTPIVAEYSEAGIVIANQNFSQAFVACGDEFITENIPQRVEDLSEDLMEAISARNVDIIILGTGISQVFPDAAILLPALKHGVGVEVMDTGAACRSYNVLVSEGRKVAGIFYPLR